MSRQRPGYGYPNFKTPASRLFGAVRPSKPFAMIRKHVEELGMTAAEVRTELLKLEAERALAVDIGVAEIAPYMADLDEEIAFCRALYVISAVTEIATLRAEMSGRQIG